VTQGAVRADLFSIGEFLDEYLDPVSEKNKFYGLWERLAAAII
jgi:hypothetical protein